MNNNLLFKNPLKENKNHLIDRLNLTAEQKEEIKAFFTKHPSYENKIDWNNKSLSYKDFESLLALDGKSKTQAKKNGLAGLVEGKDYVDLREVYIEELGKCHFYQPLTYLGSKTLASNAVAPVRGNGAQWCIAYQKDSQYWRLYTNRGVKFLFVFTEDTKYALTIYPKSLYLKNEVYSFADKNLGWPSWCNTPYILKCIENLKEISKPTLEELLEQYKGILVKNSDGTIDKISEVWVNLKEFESEGHFICKFNKWEGDFDCSYSQLISLIGAPKIVNGNFNCSNNSLISLEGGPEIVGGVFDCGYNKLISLKGCPKKVGKSFDCSNNQLTSLEGAPEEITFDFRCCHNKLTSLEGAPKIVKRDFNCACNNLTSLKGVPEEIGGDFFCQYNKLTSLRNAPKEVGKSFDCNHNKLISLIGAPKIVEGYFDCSNNKLSSLKNSPEKVKRSFNCRYNPLTSLEGAPTKVGDWFFYDSSLKEEARARGFKV